MPPSFQDSPAQTGASQAARTMAPKIRFEALDAWRGIAATIVALFHLVVFSHFSDIALIRHGWIFVDFFFVLSGFVITHAYFADLREKYDISTFMIRRFGRLWPLHISVLGVFVLFELTKVAFVKAHLAVPQPLFNDATGTSLRSLVENIFLVQAVGIDTVHSWNDPSWSISTEFWTYSIFAAVCLLPSRRLIAVAAGSIALLSAYIIARYSPYGFGQSFTFGMPRCLYGFFSGHLVYRLWSSGTIRLKYPAPMEMLALVLVVLFASWVQPNIGSLVAPFIFGFAVLVFAFEGGPISKLMRHRAILALGAWSYSIYMVHVFIVILMEKFGNLATHLSDIPGTIKMKYIPIGTPENFIFFGNKWTMDILVLIYLLVVISVASLTYRYIEQPGRRVFNRLARRPQVEAKPISWP